MKSKVVWGLPNWHWACLAIFPIIFKRGQWVKSWSLDWFRETHYIDFRERERCGFGPVICVSSSKSSSMKSLDLGGCDVSQILLNGKKKRRADRKAWYYDGTEKGPDDNNVHILLSEESSRNWVAFNKDRSRESSSISTSLKGICRWRFQLEREEQKTEMGVFFSKRGCTGEEKDDRFELLPVIVPEPNSIATSKR